VVNPTGDETLEVLCLRRELAAVPSFEFALRERVSRLAVLQHDGIARVRAVERLADGDSTLAIISDRAPGIRLATLLARAEQRQLNFDIRSALWLIRQLVPAIVQLHQTARDVAHGALGPERLVVTPAGNLIVVEHVMGAALEQLRLTPERYWAELRIPLPATSELPRFSQRADVMQIGMVALSLIVGRLIRADEHPERIADLVASTWATSSRGGFEPLPSGLRAWLGRALQMEARTAFATAEEAQAELEKIAVEDGTSSESIEAFLKRQQAVARSAPGTPTQPHAATAPAAARPAPAAPKPAAVPRPVAVQPAVPPPAELPRAQPIARVETQAASPPAVSEATAPHHSPLAARRVFENPEAERAHWTDEQADSATPRRGHRKAAVAALLAIAVVGGGTYATRFFPGAPAGVEAIGTLQLTTTPSGAEAFVDGEARGVTPLALTLPPGDHRVEVRSNGVSRSVAVTMAAGAQLTEHVELTRESPALGGIEIATEPPGARVSLDGVSYGVSPIVIPDLEPGEHIVSVQSDAGSVKQVVLVEAGATASLIVPLAPREAPPAPGFVAVSAPVEVQIYQGGSLLGTSGGEPVGVGAGRQEITIVNDVVGYRATRVVEVPAGEVVPIQVEMPNGTMALNALPWAEVWLDGERVGETPLGNLSVPLGPHSILFRHPELGEQERRVVVTLDGVTRVSVDLNMR
jgi:hypothetical protein